MSGVITNRSTKASPKEKVILWLQHKTCLLLRTVQTRGYRPALAKNVFISIHMRRTMKEETSSGARRAVEWKPAHSTAF